MTYERINWTRWQQFFAARGDRRLPSLMDSNPYTDVPDSVAKSLAIFQLGESGGGTIVEQARNSRIKEIDDEYAHALELFVNEEHRHAELLAICVRNLGGSLISKNWTASLFVFARRLIGLRLKVLVLLVAEIVGICYYQLLASRLPAGRLRSLLAQIVTDEQSHLRFHCSFLRTQTKTRWRRLLFVSAWRVTTIAAAVAVFIDHRVAMRDLNLTPGIVWRRWMSYSRLAEGLVTNRWPATVNEPRFEEDDRSTDDSMQTRPEPHYQPRALRSVSS